MRTRFLGCMVSCLFFAACSNVPPATTGTQSVDLGLMRNVAPAETVSATLSLKLKNPDQLDSTLSAIYDPTNPQYRHFMTPEQFQAQFGPDQAAITAATMDLQRAGLTVQSNPGEPLLHVSGSPMAMEQAFGVDLHVYEAPSASGAGTYRYHAPVGTPSLSAIVANAAAGVVGLDTQHRYQPRSHHLDSVGLQPNTQQGSAGAPNTPDAPGHWTPADTAQYYNVTPLYNQGYLGQGHTLGIVTLAAFTPSDAFTYWSRMGLTVDPNRITVINIDNGPGAPSDASNSTETTIDVEQSGGIAPGAKIIVYQAPNTAQAFVDAFARAIRDNNAEAVSTSWGEWEEEHTDTVGDPNGSGSTTVLQAMDTLFKQAAVQGQSLFAASGDVGAYDASENFPLSQYSQVLSVDHPASDPWITAAGGTTLPGTLTFTLKKTGQKYTVNIPQERGWSEDYLNAGCEQEGEDPITCGVFPVGSGGGVSVIFPVPSYQSGLAGIRKSAWDQSLLQFSHRPRPLITLPSNYAGRNVPDIALNGDWNTGYTLFYTSDQNGYWEQAFWGGTSFVAPQLAGIATLLNQSTGSRVGFLNFQLYAFAQSGSGYGANGPFRDITTGDNDYYYCGPGYDPVTGLGVLNVANLAAAL